MILADFQICISLPLQWKIGQVIQTIPLNMPKTLRDLPN